MPTNPSGGEEIGRRLTEADVLEHEWHGFEDAIDCALCEAEAPEFDPYEGPTFDPTPLSEQSIAFLRGLGWRTHQEAARV